LRTCIFLEIIGVPSVLAIRSPIRQEIVAPIIAICFLEFTSEKPPKGVIYPRFFGNYPRNPGPGRCETGIHDPCHRWRTKDRIRPKGYLALRLTVGTPQETTVLAGPAAEIALSGIFSLTEFLIAKIFQQKVLHSNIFKFYFRFRKILAKKKFPVRKIVSRHYSTTLFQPADPVHPCGQPGLHNDTDDHRIPHALLPSQRGRKYARGLYNAKC
jgi:hypothetical protein